MRIAIITDTHFGARSDSPIFLHHFFDFVEDVFLPYLEEHKIDTVFHLGDLLDRRKFVNFATLNEVRKRFILPLTERCKVYAIPGNHDVYFKNTNQVNSMRELFSTDFGDGLLEHPKVLEFDGCKIAFVPWITKDNHDECMEFIKKAAEDNVPFLMGHLELNGYEVMRGVKHEDGMDPAVVKDFEAVLSGHFHQKQSRGNVHYLGTPYQITFADLNEPKGFHVLDTDDHTLEYIRNPLTIFTQLVYDDSSTDYTEYDLDKYKYTFVRIVVRKKDNPVMFDSMLDRLTNLGVYGATVIEDKEMGITLTEQVDVAQDTLTIINNEIDQLKVSNPNKLKNILKELYLESLYA
jgi:DNA repair exonuclease SbcCD nuclease subunit